MAGAAPRRRSPRDQRRRSHGQNFLADAHAVRRVIGRLDLRQSDLVIDLGAGRGALTFACAPHVAQVIAVELDEVWAQRLADGVRRRGLGSAIEVVHADMCAWRPPSGPHRVLSSPPFGRTTDLLCHLLDDASTSLIRCDLILQLDVVRKLVTSPPASLRSAAWAPWWTFEMGSRVDRRAFRPVPLVDAAMITVRRRPTPILPVWLSGGFHAALRPAWIAPRATVSDPAPSAVRRRRQSPGRGQSTA